MSVVYRCDRCATVTDLGDPDEGALPDGWEERSRPVRGSEGARSSTVGILCGLCDDALYEWWL